MATSNRDRVGTMFELIAPALDAFITERVAPQIGDHDWTDLVRLVDQQKGAAGNKKYDRADPQVALRMLTENIPHRTKPGWYPFDGVLTHTHQAYARELRETRDSWAHLKAFDDDATYRSLDTARLLMSAIGATDAAERIDAIRLEVRRLAADKQDRRSIRASAVVPDVAGLAPWRSVLRPRDEVAQGTFQSSEFAADLYKVATSDPTLGGEYSDPAQFFARTYLTAGLRDLITRAVKRLTGDANAAPVINLQTNFGGGKTHSMLALWHLAGGLPLGQYPQHAQDLLVTAGYPEQGISSSRVAIVGNHVAPQGERKPDGTLVHTLWGELAWQLGGRGAYDAMRRHDEGRTSPGADLHRLLEQHAPAVILIDEWVAYARQLYGRDDVAGGTFDTQFTFAQELTEAARATPGILLAISIPASHDGDDGTGSIPGAAEEVGGSYGMEALRRLQNVVRRVADQWSPATGEEAFRIVKQRLFETENAAALAQINATVKRFTDFYAANATEFPKEARDPRYGDRIRLSYPLHPELFDRLYEDWSSLERFQRTRGVLRLMNAVIHALWVGEDHGPLIMPGSIPLSVPAVNAELTQYLQDSWKAVIDADVDGPNSEPARIDGEKKLYGERSITKRLARTVFFGAAPTIGTAQKGIDTQRVFLGTAVPGDVVGNFHSALNVLADRATYFYSGAGKWWYDTQANITRRAKDAADALHEQDVWVEITRRLAAHAKDRGGFAGVHVAPVDSGDVPDIDQARLVLLHPRHPHRRKSADSIAMRFAHSATERRGTANRVNRNMLVFLAPDEDRLAELDAATRTHLAWKEIAEKANDLNLTHQQLGQAVEKRDQAARTVDDRLALTYQWALVPTAPDPGAPFEIEEVRIDGTGDSMAARVARKLGSAGLYGVQHAARSIRLALDQKAPQAWRAGHVAVGDLWKLYAEYPYMPRLRDREVLLDAIPDIPLLWQQDAYALAAGWDGARYVGLWLPGEPGQPPITDSTLLVTPAAAVRQRAAEPPAGTDAAGAASNGTPVTTPAASAADSTAAGSAASGTTGPGVTGQGIPASTVAKPVTRYVGSATLDPHRYGADFSKIAAEVLAHLADADGVNLRLSLSIDAEATSGFTESQIRTIRENAATLRFATNEFETD